MRPPFQGSRFAVLLLALSSACAVPTAQQRAAIVLAGRGVVAANAVCADHARELAKTDKAKALDFAKTCSRVSREAIGILYAAEAALDAADTSKVSCAALAAARAIRLMAPKAVPPIVVHALELAESIAAGCRQ